MNGEATCDGVRRSNRLMLKNERSGESLKWREPSACDEGAVMRVHSLNQHRPLKFEYRDHQRPKLSTKPTLPQFDSGKCVVH